MSLDRFITFAQDRAPTTNDIERVVRNVLGQTGIMTRDRNADRLMVELPGVPTNALQDIAEGLPSMKDRGTSERWIEVFYHRVAGIRREGEEDRIAVVDVITRQADEFTNAIAACIHEVLMRYWNGRNEP